MEKFEEMANTFIGKNIGIQTASDDANITGNLVDVGVDFLVIEDDYFKVVYNFQNIISIKIGKK